jgi:hypothetical protein
MSKIMISELEATTQAPDSSYIAIDDGTTTNKITVANFNSNANATAKYYAEQAEGFATTASGASTDATAAKNATEVFVGTASNYANAASTSASAAAGSATEASGYVGTARTYASNAQASAQAAAASAAGIDDQVKLAKSWAVGNTGVRGDEATNNSKYWSEIAQAAAGGGVTTFNGRSGIVEPESGDYSSDMIPHTNTDSSLSNVQTEINTIKETTVDMVGATSEANGSHGFVPAPLIADLAKFLRGDGTWAEVVNALASLSDVNLTSLADGDMLRYNATSQKFENVPYKYLTATLAAGSTTVTFSDAAITATAKCTILTDPELNHTSVNTSTANTVVITFPAQTSPVTVGLEIRG